jgi:hypothetical protein
MAFNRSPIFDFLPNHLPATSLRSTRTPPSISYQHRLKDEVQMNKGNKARPRSALKVACSMEEWEAVQRLERVPVCTGNAQR